MSVLQTFLKKNKNFKKKLLTARRTLYIMSAEQTKRRRNYEKKTYRD
uniref:Uncharacterized protein n=1 Tax=Myoviridae sp. ctLq07 TaxID=2827681 RepID=A0A8S5TBG2_9CAUD|nr:MAG TPA: hypothetical protein [Myoviridae sp. ctLq07]